MSSWAGFTDEELSRLRQQNTGEQLLGSDAPGGRKKAAINTAKRQRPREKVRTRAASSDVKAPPDKQEENADSQRDSALSERRNSATTSNSSIKGSTSRLDSREEERENSSPECERRNMNKQTPEEAPPKRKSVKKTDDSSENTMEEGDGGTEKEVICDLPEIIDEKDKIQAIELSALEKMQEKQKEIEEENKRKKAALQETIKKRYQRTQAEAHTLSLVQKELSHLDSLLSADVAILRDKIEESSREYLHAQKRYEKAEQEFVEAKMDLHRKTERKDLLTEHLYTIIRENELRKARKLEELMAKLNVSPNDTNFLQQQRSFLEAGSDKTATKQNNAEMSVPQEEKVSTENQELNSTSNNSQVDEGGNTAVCKETNDGVTLENLATDSLSENETKVTN